MYYVHIDQKQLELKINERKIIDWRYTSHKEISSEELY